MKENLINLQKINFHYIYFFCLLIIIQVSLITSHKINNKWNFENSLNFWKSNINNLPDFDFRISTNNENLNYKNKTNKLQDKDIHLNDTNIHNQNSHLKSDKDNKHKDKQHFHPNDTAKFDNYTKSNNESEITINNNPVVDKNKQEKEIIKDNDKSENKNNEENENTKIHKINNTVNNGISEKLMQDMMINLKDIKRTMEITNKFHLFFEQLKAHELRQTELRNEVDSKLKDIQKSEKKIVKF